MSGSLTWTATAKGAPIQKVDFPIDGTKRWTENFAPYQFNGDPTGVLDTTKLSNGTHTLTVVAYGTSGQTATSKISVKVSNGAPPPPTFTTTSSVADRSTLSGSLTWTATAKGAPIQKVDFPIDGTTRWTENFAPYQFNGDTTGALDTTKLSDGTHTLTVVARAVNGRTATVQSAVTVANRCFGSAGIPERTDRSPRHRFLPETGQQTGQQTGLTAAWTAVSGASGYRVGRNGVALTDTVQTTYSWLGLTCGTTYSLTVQPETSSSDTKGKVATVSATTASCGSSGGGGGGSPVFKGDFEAGNISPWQSTPWGGAQCLNYGVPSDSDESSALCTSSTTPSRRATTAAVSTCRQRQDNACELLRGRTIAMDDEWYSMEVRFPSDWQEPSPAGWGMSLAQFNFENIWGTPLSVSAHSNYVGLTLNAGLCTSVTSGNPSCENSSGIGEIFPGNTSSRPRRSRQVPGTSC